MKTLLLFLLPVLSFAQNQLPDTLYLIDGRSTPCLITSMDDSKIHFNYSHNRSEFIIIKALERVSLESFGTVYKSGNGFMTDEDILIKFIEDRVDKISEEQELKAELSRLSLVPVKEEEIGKNTEPEKIELGPISKSKDYKKWSFGILYVPYYSGKIYEVISNNYYPLDPSIFGYTQNEINMETQLSYGITQEIRITLDAGYTSSLEESRYEYHYRNTGYEDDNGAASTLGLKMLDFTLGLKYYFKNIITEKVSIYATAGFGKQIAFAQNEYEQLFQDPQPLIINEDNIEEFTEELNSPWHFNIGFGAEYFFNESLSLTSNIRVLYSSVTGKYNSRYVFGTESRTNAREYTFRDFITRIGLGLNFYF